MTGTTSRRAVLAGTAALGVAAATAWPAAAKPAKGAGHPVNGDPFTLGVASGEPDHHSVVLWTRLAPNPLAEDGLGGMTGPATVQWEIATDERFRGVLRRGQERTDANAGYAVHVEVAGLPPGREYFYRFRTGAHLSPAGRTRTAPPPGALTSPLITTFASCSHYGEGYFTAYRRMAEDQPGLILHLGDYQYEYPAKAADVRKVIGPETIDLATYRLRHAQYKTDPDLQFAHATAPWLVVPDDHEAENNWADEIPEASSQTPGQAFLPRRAAAFRAYYENMPLRRSSAPSGIDMRLYRRVRWGSLANFHMLDTRQYRDDQLFGDGNKPDAPQLRDPNRTITGAEQERWLLSGLRDSRARWDLLGQQVWFAQYDHDPGEAKILNMDSWDGYQASRDRIRAGFAKARNTVVLTGDVHSHWAADIKADFANPDSATVATELVTTSITSGRDGADTTPGGDRLKSANPHVKFYSYRRGYVRTRIDRERVTADFRTLDYVTTPGAPAKTAAAFTIEDRRPGLQPR